MLCCLMIQRILFLYLHEFPWRNRQNYLLENIKGIQTIITCTGLEEFVKNGININQTFEIVQGKINGNWEDGGFSWVKKKK